MAIPYCPPNINEASSQNILPPSEWQQQQFYKFENFMMQTDDNEISVSETQDFSIPIEKKLSDMEISTEYLETLPFSSHYIRLVRISRDKLFFHVQTSRFVYSA